MDNGKAAEGTSSKRRFFKFCRSPEKVIACIPFHYHIFRNVWLRLDENWGGSGLLKILAAEILRVHLLTPPPTPWTRRKQTWKVPCLICSSYRIPSFRRFALWSTFFKILHIRGFSIDSQLKISKCHKIKKFGRSPRKVIACIPP